MASRQDASKLHDDSMSRNKVNVLNIQNSVEKSNDPLVIA